MWWHWHSIHCTCAFSIIINIWQIKSIRSFNTCFFCLDNDQYNNWHLLIKRACLIQAWLPDFLVLSLPHDDWYSQSLQLPHFLTFTQIITSKSNKIRFLKFTLKIFLLICWNNIANLRLTLVLVKSISFIQNYIEYCSMKEKLWLNYYKVLFVY